MSLSIELPDELVASARALDDAPTRALARESGLAHDGRGAGVWGGGVR